MKRQFLLLLLIMVACTSTLWASDILVGGIWYDLNDNNQIATVTYRGSSYSSYSNEYTGAVIIPDSITYNGVTYHVKRIGKKAFQGCTRLNSVTIPNSIIDIEDDAFSECTGLTSIEIPNSVTSIGAGTFEDCISLTSITIPNSVTSIGAWAFESCTGLTSVHITDIASWCSIAFANSDSNPLIFAHRLYLNEELVTDLTIPDGVTSIGAWAFESCTGLTSVIIPNSVTSIGNGAFDYCKSLTYVTIPNSITSIENNTFMDCSSLTSITIPDNVTSIGNYAFYRCSSLTSITIPDNVTSIGKSAFSGCTSLISVTIPNSVISIGEETFSGCINLKTVTLNANSIVSKDYSTSSSIKDIFGAQVTKYIIENSVTKIGMLAFYKCTGLTSVTISENVQSTGKYPFYECTNLDTVVWNAVNCTTFDDGQYVYPPFQECENITSFTIGENVQTLPRGLCFGMPISEISIPNGVISIGISAFRECTNLKSVNIPNSVTSIGISAFLNCSSLTSIEIPNSVTSISDGVFYGCSGLTSATIGNSVTEIGVMAFYGCSGINSIDIPNSVTSLGESAFESCTNLTSLSLGKNITTFGDSVFAYCPNIVSILNYRQTPARLGKGAFNNIDYFNCTLYVLAGSVDMYKASGSDWKDFYFIKPIGASSVSTEEIQVTPYDNSAEVVWPSVEGASTYELVIKDKSGNVVCTLIFNENGQLTQIAFNVPSRNGTPQQTQTAGFAFTITGLEAGTGYDLTMISKDNNGATLETQTLSFTTTLNGETIEAIDQVGSQQPNAKSQKIIKDGQVLILRGEKVFTLQGQEVK